MMKRNTFTLIELLICIGIIAILVAMLLPALARTKYVAKLTVCMNDLHQWGSGLAMYASENSNRLPYRKVYTGNNRQPHMLKGLGGDDRQLWEDAYGIKYANCLFVGEPPYDMASVSSSWVFGTYEMWAGAEIDKNQPGSKMMKITETMKWTKAGKEYEFDVWMTDQDRTRLGSSNSVMTSHPDSAGALQLYDPGLSYRIWCYFSWGGYRGTLDRNFLHSDGSVNRITKVATPTPGFWDPRLVRIPYQSDWVSDSASAYLPQAN